MEEMSAFEKDGALFITVMMQMQNLFAFDLIQVMNLFLSAKFKLHESIFLSLCGSPPCSILSALDIAPSSSFVIIVTEHLLMTHNHHLH